MASLTSSALLSFAMEDEICTSTKAESVVKDLQQLLFPISPRKASSDSYLCNFLLKTSNALEFDDDRISQIVRFKDSKESISKDLDCASQPARWPTECQVIEDKITHIQYVPSFPEPFNTPTGREVQPKPVGEECGTVVYQYHPISAVNYFSRSSVGGSRYLLPTCPCPEEECLRFESRFESGNLAKAIKITNTYYELYLRTDMYTSKHTQWFYFKIAKMRKNMLYRFSIVNLSKEGSLYNEGMKLLMYSEKDAQLHSIGWRRCGDNITYFCNDTTIPDDPDQQQLYTLTFTLEFPHDDDAVYLAHSYPYTYSDLQNYLQELTSHPIKSTFSNLRLLCRTLAGNNVYYITITSPQVAGDKKQAIVITARVHPGETPSSWMMKGFLDFLTSDSGPAKELRDKFIFKLVPMLNPDGVIVGNNRCSLTGRDLNRQYRTVIRETYPSIWYTKLMIRRLLEECGVAMYCDLHAHSRKHNIFIYGCENRRGMERRLHEQVFPLMLHKNAADKFSFENCKFRVQKCKEGTGRVVMWMMGIANSFTMEASFGGSTLSARAETHFTTNDYEQMGKSFCQTLLDFYDDDPRKMFKANLGMSLNTESLFTSDIDSSSDTEMEAIKPVKVTKKKKKKKKSVGGVSGYAKSKPHPVHILPVEFSDSEIQLNKKEQSVSMFDMIPEPRMRSQSWQRGLRVPTTRNYIDNKHNTARQLAEVQLKLLSLRNKLWFGVGDTEPLASTLTWGTSSFCISSSAPQQKLTSKQSKKKHQKHEKEKKDKRNKIKLKETKEVSKEKSIKKDKSYNFKRQTAIDWTPCDGAFNEKLKKLKNLAETTAKFQGFASKATDDGSNAKKHSSLDKDDNKAGKKKKHLPRKKGKESKLEKTAKAVTNANMFIRKD